MKRSIQAAVWLLGAQLLSQNLRAQTDYTLTVQPGAMQTFDGFGASQVSGDATIPDAARGQLERIVYHDLGAKILRLWVGSAPDVSGSKMKQMFYASYVDTGVISRITGQDVSTLLLAPARGESEPADDLHAYAAKLAQFILDIKTERGIAIQATGVANEPLHWTPEEIAAVVRYLREELNHRGLDSVRIIAPECAEADSDCDRKLDTLQKNDESWSGLSAIASHSYNMAATGNEASRTEGKPYWMTEASDNGNETAENTSRAATVAARFLNDVNHGVTDWIYFIGFSFSDNVATDSDNATKLAVWDKSSKSIFTPLKYYYLKQLLSMFDSGAVFRRTVSGTESDMTYTLGMKPAINAAAAVNPDGSWSISVVNDTGSCCRSKITDWHTAAVYKIRIDVAELHSTRSKKFTLYQSKANCHFQKSGSVKMTHGSMTVIVSPGELISLRSAGERKAP
jgi:hypothetical protein